MLNDVEFREVQEVTKIEKVKIVACDGKSKFKLLLSHVCIKNQLQLLIFNLKTIFLF